MTGAPVTDMKITITGGRAHDKHTEGGDFRQATYRAIRQGLRKSLAAGEMVLLEPWYEFELEVIVFAAWSGRDVRNVPVRVYYPPQDKRVSHFKPLRDFTRISILNTLLVLISLLYIKPRNFLRLCTWKNICAFFDRNLIHVQDSNRKIVFSVWTGTFCAFLPFYGYQLILAVFLAHLLKLNKLVAGAFSAVSLPPLIPFIVFGSYWLGCAILGR